jgi:L-malate glycosyltransferase
MPTTEPLRVLQLIKSLGRGGAEMLLPETLRHADRDRFLYRYAYFLPWKDAMVRELERQGVDVTCLSRSNQISILLSARELAQKLKAWKVDIVHCHLPVAGVVGRIAGKLASVPVVYTEHNVLERYHPLTRRANLFTWGWQQEVVAVSRDVAESLERSAPAPVPINVVLNGVDVHRFEKSRVDGQALRRGLGIPDDAPVVGTVAVFRTQKRLHKWLEVARTLTDRHPGIRFLLVGDGPLREELEARARSMGLQDVAHWAGLQEDVRPYLAVMDVYMMSSVFEGLPVAMLEAMSMSCGLVCTAVGGIPEVIRNGENGLLVDAEHPERLADRASELLSSREMLGELGAEARRTVERDFSIARMTQELENLYVRVVRDYRNGR